VLTTGVEPFLRWKSDNPIGTHGLNLMRPDREHNPISWRHCPRQGNWAILPWCCVRLHFLLWSNTVRVYSRNKKFAFLAW